MARSITDPDRQAEALAAVAVAAGPGRPARPGRAAGPLHHHPDRQAEALAAVAVALAQAGLVGQAAHAAVLACAVGRWTMLLGPVLSLQPSAIVVVADLCADVPRNAEQETDPV